MLNNEFSHLHAVSVEKALPSAFPCFHFNSRQTHDFQWASKYLQFNPRLPPKRGDFEQLGRLKIRCEWRSFVVVLPPLPFTKFTEATTQTF